MMLWFLGTQGSILGVQSEMQLAVQLLKDGLY